ncbi:MAG: hypothetical protein EOP51_28920, partial [Sphingobacteriales bacterium]
MPNFKISAALYALIILLFSACGKVNTPAPEVKPVDSAAVKEPHVYLIGTTWSEADKKYNAFAWKDGNLAFLNSSDEVGSAMSIAVQGGDIFVGGYIKKPSNESQVATYWKNGIPTTIEADQEFGSSVQNIAVSGNDVYAVGWVNGAAKYWKNGISHLLQSPSMRNTAKAVAVKGDDLYIGGYYTDPDTKKSVPAYWKNDVLVNLPAPAGHHGMVNDIAIKGNDIYAVGYTLEVDGKNEVATYWKNGKRVALSDDSRSSSISCITISGDDIYMAGEVDRSTMVCWKNDKIIFTDNKPASEYTYGNEIFIYKKDI